MKTFFGAARIDSIGDAVRNAEQASMSADFSIPGLGKFHVLTAKYRTTAGGTLSFVCPDHTLLTCTPPVGAPVDGETISTATTFRVRGGGGVGYETREFRVEGRGPKGGTMLVAYRAEVTKMTGSNCGGFLENCHQ